MATLQSRWINTTVLEEKAKLFPDKDFCAYRPPSPEAHLYCAKEADKFNRNNSKSQKYYRCDRCYEIDPHYGNSKPKWIDVNVFRELIRLEVYTCSYSPRGGNGLFCSAPIHDGGNFCNTHTYKRDDIGKDILSKTKEQKYEGLKCHSNIWLDDLLGKDWFITNEIDETNSALIHFCQENNTICVYGLFEGQMDDEDVITTPMLMCLEDSYIIKDSISCFFTVKRSQIKDILPQK